MTIVYGQIESLTRIKETLNQKGINRFNSIDDINEFKRNSDLERQNISNQIEHDLKIEIDGLQADKNTEKAKTLKMHKTNPDRRHPRRRCASDRYGKIYPTKPLIQIHK